ncbi:MAG: DUF998 domain-containing protein [Flavobacterium sp.]
MRINQLDLFKTTAIICIAACISDFVVLFLLGSYYSGYSQLKNTISSLGANVSPVSDLISIWWMFIGIIFIFFGFIFRKAFDKNLKYVRIASVLIMLYGLGEGIGSGLFKADRIAGKMTNSFIIHDIMGGIGIIAALILPLVMLKIMTRKNAPGFYVFSWTIFVIGFITLFLFINNFSYNNIIHFYRGLWQRLFMLNLYVYFIAISVVMYHKKSMFYKAKNL